MLAPVIELGGIITILLTVALGDLSRDLFIQFTMFGYAFATVISMGGCRASKGTYSQAV
jgi:hypothetical protein